MPLAFVGLRLVPFRAAVAPIAAMTVAVAMAWRTMLSRVDPTVVLGPVAIAGLAVLFADNGQRREHLWRNRPDSARMPEPAE